MQMGPTYAETMLPTSVLILLFVASGLAARSAGEFSEEQLPQLHLTNNTPGGEGRDGLQCPAVCPACPACPAAPPCPSAPACPRAIPPGYTQHGALGYYKMHYEARTWPDAKAACEREGGYLAVLNSQSEANLASSLVTKYGLGNHIHIGFFDVTKNKKYITVLDGPLASSGYAVWSPGEPNGVGKETCGSFQPNRGLNDETCSRQLAFLCELFT